MSEDDEAQAAERLMFTRSNFAAAIRGCQTAGFSDSEIAEACGVRLPVLEMMIEAWGLDT